MLVLVTNGSREMTDSTVFGRTISGSPSRRVNLPLRETLGAENGDSVQKRRYGRVFAVDETW